MSMRDELKEDAKSAAQLALDGQGVCRECGETLDETDLVDGECHLCRCALCGGSMVFRTQGECICTNCHAIHIFDEQLKIYKLK